MRGASEGGSSSGEGWSKRDTRTRTLLPRLIRRIISPWLLILYTLSCVCVFSFLHFFNLVSCPTPLVESAKNNHSGMRTLWFMRAITLSASYQRHKHTRALFHLHFSFCWCFFFCQSFFLLWPRFLCRQFIYGYRNSCRAKGLVMNRQSSVQVFLSGRKKGGIFLGSSEERWIHARRSANRIWGHSHVPCV